MRIPLAANIESRDGGVTKDPKVMNALVEPMGQDVPPRILKRPGILNIGLVGRGTAQLLYAWNGLQTIIGDVLNSGTTTTIISGLTFTAFNPSDKGASVTLSNSNLTASISGGTAMVRAVLGESTGRWYWEVTLGTAGGALIGIATSAASLTSFVGAGTTSYGYDTADGKVYNNGTGTAYGATFTNGDVIGVALDMISGTLTFYKNGVSQGIAATGLTGTFYPAVSNSGSIATVMTANFGATSFAYSVPTGFGPLSSSQSLAPANGGLPYYAVQTNDNAATPRLFFHNRTTGWVVNRSGTISTVTFGGTMGAQTYTLNSLTRSSTTATATYTASGSAFSTGDSVTIAGASQTAYNGTFTVTATTAGSAQQSIPLTITRTFGSTTASAVTSNGQPHGLTNGSTYTISGANESAYNGSYALTVTDSTHFTYTVSVTAETPSSPATGSPTISEWQDTGVVDADVPAGSTVCTFSCFTGNTIANGEVLTITWSSAAQSAGLVNGNYTVSNKTTSPLTQFQVTVNAPAAHLSGSLFTKIVRPNPPAISGITRASQSATGTVTLSTAHNFSMETGAIPYAKLTISGASQSGYNISVFTPSITDSKHFTYTTTYTAEQPTSPATGSPIVTVPAVNPTFSYTVSGSPTTPATGTITAQGTGGIVPGTAYIDGYFLVMDTTGVLWSSNADDPTTWGASNFLTVRNENGAGKALGKSQNYVVAWKEYSTEFYFDNQNPTGSPFSPVPNGFQRIGCAHGDSVARIGSSHCWISQLREGNRSVHKIEGLQITEIGTQDIARIIDADSLATVYSYGLQLKGHALYLLTLVASNITLVYDLDSQYWSQWTSLTLNSSSKSVTSITLGSDGVTATVNATSHGFSDGDPVKIAGASQSAYNGIFQIQYVDANNFTIQVAGSPVSPATGTITAAGYTESYFKFSKATTLNGAIYLLHESDGNMYQLSSSLYQDNGLPINVFSRSARVDGGDDDKKKVPTVRWIGDKVSDIGMLRYSDDDCNTFSSYRIFDLSLLKPEIRKMKAFRRRTYEFRHVGNNRLRGEALELMGISK